MVSLPKEVSIPIAGGRDPIGRILPTFTARLHDSGALLACHVPTLATHGATIGAPPHGGGIGGH